MSIHTHGQRNILIVIYSWSKEVYLSPLAVFCLILGEREVRPAESPGASSWELKGTACCAFFSAAGTQDFDLQEMAPLRKFRAFGSKVRAESGICLACLLNWWEAQRCTERGDYGGWGSQSTVTCMSTHQTRQHQLTNRNQTLLSTATTTGMKPQDLCKTRKMTHLVCKRIWSVRKVHNCMIYLLNAGENYCFDDKAWVGIGRELSSLSHRVRTGGFPNAPSMLCHRAGCHFSSEWERRTSARFSFQRPHWRWGRGWRRRWNSQTSHPAQTVQPQIGEDLPLLAVWQEHQAEKARTEGLSLAGRGTKTINLGTAEIIKTLC